jgi:hypothetical protein
VHGRRWRSEATTAEVETWRGYTSGRGTAFASSSGIIMVAGQKIALGRTHQHQTVTVRVSETTLTVEFDDGDTRTVGAPPTSR